MSGFGSWARATGMCKFLCEGLQVMPAQSVLEKSEAHSFTGPPYKALFVTSWLSGEIAQAEGTSHIQKMRNNFEVLRYNHTVEKTTKR